MLKQLFHNATTTSHSNSGFSLPRQTNLPEFINLLCTKKEGMSFDVTEPFFIYVEFVEK
jgi:hypothetical protein